MTATRKQDFTVRASLIEKQRLFADEQLIDIYQSVGDTFEAGYELTETDARNLTGIQRQIESVLQDITQRIAGLQLEAIKKLREHSM